MRATQGYVTETTAWSTDLTENAQGYSWYTTLKTLKIGKTKLTQELRDGKLASTPHFFRFALHFSALTINKPESLYCNTHSPCKMLGVLNLITAMYLRDAMKLPATTKQIQNTKFVLNRILVATFNNMVTD